MRVQFFDLKKQNEEIRDEIDRAIQEVVDGGQFILGPQVRELEKQVAALSGCSYGIGVSSGTDALVCALMAAEVGPGDEVLVPAYSYIATSEAVVRVGAKPVFVDVCRDTLNIDLERAASRITKKTKAIIPVHLFGQVVSGLTAFRFGPGKDLVIIEDAAQAINAEDADGKMAGMLGHMCCFSFFPTKNLGGMGDGGMVVTNDPGYALKVRSISRHGVREGEKYCHFVHGGNYRLDTIQAAVLLVKLKQLEHYQRHRLCNAMHYLSAWSGIREVRPLATTRGSVYNQFVIQVEARDALRKFLEGKEVGTAVYYPMTLNQQPCYDYLGDRHVGFMWSGEATRHSLALPVYPELPEDQRDYVTECVGEFFGVAL